MHVGHVGTRLLPKDGTSMTVDRRLVEAYFTLRFGSGSRHGQSAASRPQAPDAGARRRPQSASRDGQRSAVCRQPVLRREGSRSGTLRDGAAAPSPRRPDQRRCRELWRVAADLLQGSGYPCHGRARRLAASAARAEGRTQDLRRGRRVRCRSQGRQPRTDNATMPCCRRGALRHQGPSPQPGTRAGAQKKLSGLP